MTFQFILNEDIHHIERMTETIFSVLSKVGGLISAGFLLTKLLTAWIQKRMFYNSALKRLYFEKGESLNKDINNFGPNHQRTIDH